MIQNKNKFFLYSIVWLFLCKAVQAQIVPDNTLPQNSVVNSDCSVSCQIEGGTTKNNNLFHSFKQFSVPTNGEAIFNNTPQINNIFTRVTGSSISNVDGLIKAQGSANFFLINPNGIIFGANARLDIGGSFLATTADSILFDDNTVFSAKNPQSSPLLTVSVPVGLQFGETPGEIINKSQAQESMVIVPELPPLEIPVGIKVDDGKSIALIGSGVTLNNGLLTAFGGRIELGSVAENSFVDLIQNPDSFILGYKSVNQFENISVVNQSGLIVSTPITSPTLSSSGTTQIYGSLISLNNSDIFSSNRSKLDGGDIFISATTLTIRDTEVSTTTSETGKAGDITVNADSIKLIQEDSDRDSGLFSQTLSSGNSGNITINTNDLTLENGAQIAVSTFGSGMGGNLTVNASESIELTGRTSDGEFPSGLFSQSIGGNATGDGGNLKINTGRLIVTDGARVSVGAIESNNSSRLGISEGNGGTLEINATDSIEVRGFGFDEQGEIVSSTLLSESQGIGNAGNINLNTSKLTVANLGEVNVSATGGGEAGNLNINVTNSDIPLNINFDNAEITLDNGKLTATVKRGRGGNINLVAGNIIELKNQSLISTSVEEEGNGGNITINTELLIANSEENSDIISNTEFGIGGNISINALINGIEFREAQTELSDITVVSEFGLDGTFIQTNNSRDVLLGVIELPNVPIDTATILAQDLCKFEDGKVAKGSSFIITGRGGLTPTSEDSLNNVNNVVGWANRDDLKISRNGTVGVRQRSENEISKTNYPVIQQAQGWVKTSDGSVWLVTNISDTVPQSSRIVHPNCEI